VLKKLGWSVNLDRRSNALPSLTEHGQTCSTTDAARSFGGALKLTQTSADEGVLDQALQSPLTHCAYAKNFDVALSEAARKLKKNFMYWFNIPVLGSGLVRMGALRGWERVTCLDKSKCFQPVADQFEDAFRSLYRGRYTSECASGLQITEYAAIHELFGAKTSAYFKPEELFVGSWADITRSQSVTHGQTGRRVVDRTGVNYAKLGPGMMVGLSGYIGSLYGEKFLDNKVNRNENFVLVKTSDEAASALAKNGGLPYYTALMKKIWMFSKRFSKQELADLGKDKLIARDIEGSKTFLSMLNDPFLRDTILRVHPQGNWPIKRHIVRLLRINPRTPYGLMLYPEAIHGEIFDRWLQSQLDQCSE
jgi:hypothetical protein